MEMLLGPVRVIVGGWGEGGGGAIRTFGTEGGSNGRAERMYDYMGGHYE